MGLIEDGWTQRARIRHFPDNVDSPLLNNLTYFRSAVLDGEGHGFLSHSVSGGSDFRATTDKEGNVEVPVYITNFDLSTDEANPIAHGYINMSSWSDVDNTDLYIWCGNPSGSARAVDEPLGQYATFNSDYDFYWSFNEPSGNFVNEASSSATTWTNGGYTRPTLIDGPINKALAFDGVGDRLQYSGQLITNSFHIAFFFRSSDTSSPSSPHWYSGNQILDNDTGGVAKDWGVSLMQGTTGIIAFGIGDTDTTIKGSIQVNDGVWHRVAVNWDSTTGLSQIFVDGVFDTSGTLPTGARTESGPRMGANNGGTNKIQMDIAELEVLNVTKDVDYEKAKYADYLAASSTLSHNPTMYVGKNSYDDRIVNYNVTSAGFHNVTSPNETRIPVGAFIIASDAQIPPDLASSASRSSMGYSTGDSQFLTSHNSRNVSSAANVQFNGEDTIYLPNEDGSPWALVKTTLMIPGGFKINASTFTEAFGIQVKFIYTVPIQIEGKLWTGGGIIIDDIEFAPNFVEVFNMRHLLNASEGGAYFSRGWADKDLNQRSISLFSETSGTDSVTLVRDDVVNSEFDTSGTLVSQIVISAFGTSSVSFSTSGTPSSASNLPFYVFMKLPEDTGHVFLGDQSNQSATGEANIPVPFLPTSLDVISTPVSSINQTNLNNDRISSYNLGFHSEEESVTTSYVVFDSTDTPSPLSRTTSGLTTIDKKTSATGSHASFEAFSSSGATFNWDVVDQDQTKFVYAAFRSSLLSESEVVITPFTDFNATGFIGDISGTLEAIVPFSDTTISGSVFGGVLDAITPFIDSNITGTIPKTGVDDFVFHYELDGTDSSLNHNGGDDFRIAPECSNAIGRWYNGTNQYDNANTDSDLVAVGTGAYSISFWVNTLSASMTVIENGNALTSNTFSLRIRNTGKVDLITNNLSFDSLTSVNDGIWHHCVVNVSGSSSQIGFYVDGLLESTSAAPSYNITDSSNLDVGRSPSYGEYMAGGLDGIRFYDRVLTSEEVGILLDSRCDWNPSHITTQAWFDMQDQTTIFASSGSDVSAVSDKSGNGHDVIQSTASAQPLSGADFNGLNSLLFGDSGASNHLMEDVTGTVSADEVTIATVYDAESTSLQRPVGYARTPTSNSSEAMNLATDYTLRYDGSFSGGSLTAQTGPHIRVSMRTLNTQVDFISGVSNISATASVPQVAGDINLGNSQVNEDATSFFDGKIAEAIFINANTTLENRLNLEGYLAWKWGLVDHLSASHTYKNAPPTISFADVGTVTPPVDFSGTGEVSTSVTSGTIDVIVSFTDVNVTGNIISQGTLNSIVPFTDLNATGNFEHQADLEVIVPFVDLNVTGSFEHQADLNVIVPFTDVNTTGNAISQGEMDVIVPFTDLNVTGNIISQGEMDVIVPFIDFNGTVSASQGSGLVGSTDLIVPFVATTMTGSVAIQGTLNVIFPFTDLNVTGNIISQGEMDAITPFTDFNGVGQLPIEGDLVAITPFTDFNAVGQIPTIGDLEAIIPFVDIEETGNIIVPGELDASVSFVDTEETGNIISQGELDAIVSFVDFNVSGNINIPGVMDAIIPFVDVSGSTTVSVVALVGNLNAIVPFVEDNIGGNMISQGTLYVIVPFTDFNGIGERADLEVDMEAIIPFADVNVTGTINNGTLNAIVPFADVSVTGDIPKFVAEPISNIFKPKKRFAEHWAEDVSKGVVSEGYVYDGKAINVSLENILLTSRGERLFNVGFGSILGAVPFESLDFRNAEELLDIIIRDIRRWENRIILVTDEIKMDILRDENSFTLVIPYVIKRTGLTGTFARKIII